MVDTEFNDPTLPVARATVCDGSIDTPYLRSGRGAAVVLLAPENSRAGHALLHALARHFRVIAPERSVHMMDAADSAPGFAEWLRGFLDGIGVARASLVAADALGTPALGFTMIEPDRVERLVLVDADPRKSGLPDPISDSLSRACVPLLVSWLPISNGEPSLNEIVNFLSPATVVD